MHQLGILCHQVKPPVTRIGYILLNCGQKYLIDTSKYKLLSRLLVILYTLIVRPYYWCYQTWGNWAGAQLEALPYWLVFMVLENILAYYQRRKVIISITQLQQTPVCKIYWHNVTGITNYFYFIGFKAHSMSWNPYLYQVKN